MNFNKQYYQTELMHICARKAAMNCAYKHKLHNAITVNNSHHLACHIC